MMEANVMSLDDAGHKVLILGWLTQNRLHFYHSHALETTMKICFQASMDFSVAAGVYPPCGTVCATVPVAVLENGIDHATGILPSACVLQSTLRC
jgi:hypothetical protein